MTDKEEYKKSIKIVFDVDLTLIDHEDRPLYENINILRYFINKGYDCYIASGGGVYYAEHHVRRLGLEGLVKVIEKGSIKADIAFDDEITKGLGKVAIVV